MLNLLIPDSYSLWTEKVYHIILSGYSIRGYPESGYFVMKYPDTVYCYPFWYIQGIYQN